MGVSGVQPCAARAASSVRGVHLDGPCPPGGHQLPESSVHSPSGSPSLRTSLSLVISAAGSPGRPAWVAFERGQQRGPRFVVLGRQGQQPGRARLAEAADRAGAERPLPLTARRDEHLLSPDTARRLDPPGPALDQQGLALPVLHQFDRTDLHGQPFGQRLLVRDAREPRSQGLTDLLAVVLGSPADQQVLRDVVTGTFTRSATYSTAADGTPSGTSGNRPSGSKNFSKRLKPSRVVPLVSATRSQSPSTSVQFANSSSGDHSCRPPAPLASIARSDQRRRPGRGNGACPATRDLLCGWCLRWDAGADAALRARPSHGTPAVR